MGIRGRSRSSKRHVFTGLVETVGRVAAVTSSANGRAFEISASEIMADVRPGDSISVDGICLTVAEISGDRFRVQAVDATLSRTTAGHWLVDRTVNLERALRVGDRLGGHFVQGHVDAVGTVLAVEQEGDRYEVEIALPETVAEVCVLHGSIAVDGVSLTISELEDDVARVALVPFTLSHTNLSRLQRGAQVNLEGDLLGKFVAAQLQRFR
jgi:riboflavin synthase